MHSSDNLLTCFLGIVLILKSDGFNVVVYILYLCI